MKKLLLAALFLPALAIAEPKYQFIDHTAAMVSAYEANPIKADSIYKGKNVGVVGRIKDIGRDVLDRPYLDLGKITAYFPISAEPEIAKLRKGQEVKIRGKCQGDFLGILSISESELEP